MQIKRMSLRFDLDNPEDRQAWEYLRSLNTASMNRTVLSIINQAEQSARISGMVRSIIREELCAVLRQLPVQPVEEESASEDGDGRYDHGFPKIFWMTPKLMSLSLQNSL